MSWTMVSVACVAVATLAVIVEAEPYIEWMIKKVDELFVVRKGMEEVHDAQLENVKTENEFELVV
jgi:hypothetical protein